MAINDWWRSDPTERFWMEITYRDDIGGDLLAPQQRNDGRDYWSYSLVTYVAPGDVVLHWQAQPRLAITGRSFVKSTATTARMNWESPAIPVQGRVAGGERPAWRAALDAYRPLPVEVSLEDIRSYEAEIRRVFQSLAVRAKGSVYFPFEFSDKRPLRPAQGYLVKFPKDLLSVLPGLRPLLELAVSEPGTLGRVKPAPQPRSSNSLGRMADPVKRKAIERYAVDKVTQRLVSEGWEVADVGDKESWDLTATRAGQLLHVEVKGSTTTRGGIDLTDGEVRHAEANNTTLAVVDGIRMDTDGHCSAGRLRMWNGWVPDRADLMPTAYRYLLPAQTAPAVEVDF